MDLDQENQLEMLIRAAESWSITHVPFDVCMDLSSDETTTVNLAVHIGPSTANEQSAKEHDASFKTFLRTVPENRHPIMAHRKMYLPPTYDKNNEVYRKEVVFPLISNAFNVDGGGVAAKGWEKTQNKIIFYCNRGRVNKGKEKNDDDNTNKKSCSTTTARPRSNDDKCNFRFSLYWEPKPGDDIKGRWYFYENGPGCHFHSGHFRKEKNEIKTWSDRVDANKLDIASDGMAVNLSSAAMGTLLHKGWTLS
jgi:hypothetical protein